MNTFIELDSFYKNKISCLRMVDDDFMKIIFKDGRCVKQLLEVILPHDKICLQQTQVECFLKNLHGNSVRLDVLAIDDQGICYDIEFQKDISGASIKRARKYGSIVDTNTPFPTNQYSQIRDIYIIFICEEDVFHKGLPIYHIERYIDETKTRMSDGLHMIYLNLQHIDDSPLGLLKQDLLSTDVNEMHYEILRERVRYYKETEEGVRKMCEIFEEIREYGRQQGHQEGETEEARRIFIDLMNAKFGHVTEDVEILVEETNLDKIRYALSNIFVIQTMDEALRILN